MKPWSNLISNSLKAKTPPKEWHFDKVRVLTNATRYPPNTPRNFIFISHVALCARLPKSTHVDSIMRKLVH
jgi:hypothetical protein